jgi:uncharacterized protein YidB (DUF937 family)
MGMLDGLLGSALNGLAGGAGGSQAQNPLVQAALQLLEQNGGISGVIERFRQAGFAEQADSWVATGANRPIEPHAVQQALGPGALSDIASRLGMSGDAAAGGLASVLPQLIDQLTPHGAIPGNQGDVVAQALAMLRRTGAG